MLKTAIMLRDVWGTGVVLLGLSVSVQAQQPTLGTPAAAPPGAWPAPAHGSLIPTDADTGILVPGHRDFARYDTPDRCLAAVTNTMFVLRRTLEVQASLDTIAPLQDTVGSRSVATVARACADRFVIPSMPTGRDLSIRFGLAIAAENDSLAQAILRRANALVTTPTEQDAIRVGAVGMFLTAMPARVAMATTLVAEMDSLGRPALEKRLQAHQQLLMVWQRSGDAQHSRQEAERILTLGRALPDDARQRSLGRKGTRLGPMLDAYHTLLALAVKTHSDSVSVLARQYAADLHRPLPSAAALQAVVDSLSLPEPGDYAGTRVPPIDAAVWFPPPGAPAGDTVRPVRGKVNVYVAEGGATMTARVRRWLTQYGAQGLVVTVVSSTNGWSISLGEWNPYVGPWTPTEEGQQLQWYWQDYAKLPVAVAVQETHFRWRPAPDGRRIQADTTPFVRAACGRKEDDKRDCVVLIGRDGKVLMKGHLTNNGDTDGDFRFKTLLAWAVAHPAEAPPVGSAASSPQPRPSAASLAPSTPVALSPHGQP